MKWKDIHISVNYLFHCKFLIFKKERSKELGDRCFKILSNSDEERRKSIMLQTWDSDIFVRLNFEFKENIPINDLLGTKQMKQQQQRERNDEENRSESDSDHSDANPFGNEMIAFEGDINSDDFKINYESS